MLAPLVYLFLLFQISKSLQPSWRKSTSLKLAKGFGDSSSVSKLKLPTGKPWKVEKDKALELEFAKLTSESDFPKSITTFLNKDLLKDTAKLQEVSLKLKAGHVVVLRNAFHPVFAEITHRELKHPSTPWTLNEQYFEDGYHHKHSNVYDQSKWSERMKNIFEIFDSAETKQWINGLSGRTCSGVCTGAPSYYKAGDHSLPHTDWIGQRTVAYIWHLSKDWKPEWGGGLYWAQDPHAVATYPASFNTLVLFSVSTKSSHFVTTVSPHATSQRLTFNGWWNDHWVPTCNDDFEELLSTPEKRSGITHLQLQVMTDLLSDEWQRWKPRKKAQLEELRAKVYHECFPLGQGLKC